MFDERCISWAITLKSFMNHGFPERSNRIAGAFFREIEDVGEREVFVSSPVGSISNRRSAVLHLTGHLSRDRMPCSIRRIVRPSAPLNPNALALGDVHLSTEEVYVIAPRTRASANKLVRTRDRFVDKPCLPADIDRSGVEKVDEGAGLLSRVRRLPDPR